MSKGYAIIMTNDNYSGKNGEGTAYQEVALNKEREIPRNKDLRLKIKGYENKPPIHLEGKYTCEWHPYNLKNTKITYKTPKQGEKCVPYEKYPFEYMIMEVK